MTFYRVATLPKAQTEIQAIAFPFRREIGHALVELQRQPRPKRSRLLAGGLHMLPVHGWSILYVVDDDAASVTVLHVFRTP